MGEPEYLYDLEGNMLGEVRTDDGKPWDPSRRRELGPDEPFEELVLCANPALRCPWLLTLARWLRIRGYR
jgi:hypothetical protein